MELISAIHRSWGWRDGGAGLFNGGCSCGLYVGPGISAVWGHAVMAHLRRWHRRRRRRSVSKLLADRDETQKHGQALQVAGKKKAPPDEVCKLFNAFLAAEGKMIKGLEENSALCGVPADVIKRVKAGHSKASQVGKQVCEVAGERTRPLMKVLERAPEQPCAALWARLSCPLEGEN